jgi:nitroimidazol reductase NimA-like FMN-containing flavoprotein (pyridoxamine 5'-phosphate oxidase superfamily)
MRIDGAGLRVLTREECLALLATAQVGHIGVSTRALPLILPVCFAMDDEQIVISTQHGTTLDTSTRDTVVAFEADGPSSHSKVGWSVHSTGIARHVTDPIELDRLAALPLPSWSLGSPARFVTITTDQMSGRLAADTIVPLHHTRHRLSDDLTEA